MTEKRKTYQLILRQRPSAHSQLDDLLRDLEGRFGLDTYIARQRMVGPGLALFGAGQYDKTLKMAEALQNAGYACWLVEQTEPKTPPELLRSLEIRDQEVAFACRKGVVRLARGTAVVGVLADISGSLVDKHVKRLLAQNAYLGADALEVLSHDEIIRAIYQGQPMFDFYLLDGVGAVQQAVRVMPGRFNIDGLGARASLSTTQNLAAVVELVAEYARPCRLHYDFGLSQIPDCRVKRLTETPTALMENLDSLTRYGWLMTQLQGDGRPVAGQAPADDATLVAAMGLAATAGQPLLGDILAQEGTASSLPELAEALQEVRAEFNGSPADQASSDGPDLTQQVLPPPPERPTNRMRVKGSLKTLGGMLVGTMAGLAVSVGSNGDELFRLAARYSMRAGIVPALVALGLFWSGFHFIRLKRRIENTPTSKIRSMAMGMVEIHGRARRSYALVSPMTQNACAWYRLRKYRKDSKDNWRLAKEVNSNHVPFQIDDGTGRVTIEPTGASIKAQVHHTGYPGQSTLTFTAFGGDYDDDEKWVENLIYEGTSLYVLGYAQPLREQKLSLRERTMAKLRQLKLDAQAMRRYDTDGDGQIGETEWQTAREEMEQASLKEHLAESRVRKRQEEHAVIVRPPQRSLPFIIAEASSELHLTRKYGWASVPLLAGGVGATVLAIYKFLQFLGV